MTTALITCAFGEKYRALVEITRPTFERYAARHGFEFIILTEHTIGCHPIFEKMRCAEALEQYDRVIFVDADVVITPDCPDLLNLVPDDHFGAYVVSQHTSFHDSAISLIQSVLSDIGWSREYFNSGVMVMSRCHRAMLNSSDPDFATWSDLCEQRAIGQTFADQTYLNYKLKQLGFPLYDIGYRFNHTLASKNSATRFASNIIHCKGHRRGDRLKEARRTRFVVERPALRRMLSERQFLARAYDLMP